MNKNLGWYVLGGLALFACILVFSFQGAYNGLLSLQANHGVAEGNFNAGVTLLTQKIDAMVTIMEDTMDAETFLQTGVAEARSGYTDAVENGTPLEVVQAATPLVGSIKIAVENPPTTGFADLGAGTQREVSEAYNQLLTLLSDVNNTAGSYNVQCRKLFMPMIACNLGGFPDNYAYFEGTGELPSSYDDIVGTDQ